MDIPKLASMNTWALMQIFRQHNGHADEELRIILSEKLLQLPLDTQLERLKVETNSELKELLEISVAKRYSIDITVDTKKNNKTLPEWYFNRLMSIDAANVLIASPDENIRIMAEEKCYELLEKYLNEFEGKEEMAFYDGKIGRLFSTPENNNDGKRKIKETKIYQFRRNEE